jgi:hypothetical protein
MRCPYCAEDITDDDATRCPHCGSALPTAAGPRPTQAAVASGGWGSGWDPTPAPVSAAPGPAAPPQAAPRTPVTFSHSGQRYLLGYDATHFGIWDRSSPAEPTERFPRSDEGWSQAWARYHSLEPHSQPVQAAPPQQAQYGGPGPGPAQPPWQQGPPVYYLPQQQRTNGLAVAALVLGIIGVILAPIAIPEILALVFGLVSLNQIRESSGAQAGRGLAIAGISLGSVGIGIFIIWIAVHATNTTSGF